MNLSNNPNTLEVVKKVKDLDTSKLSSDEFNTYMSNYTNNNITPIQTSISNLSSRISDVQANLVVDETNISGLQTDVSNLKSTVSAINIPTNVSELNNDAKYAKITIVRW